MLDFNVIGNIFGKLELNFFNQNGDKASNNIDPNDVSKMLNVFSFKGNDCLITAPIMKTSKPTDETRTQDVVLINDIYSINNIIEMVSLHKKRISFNSCVMSSPHTEIHLGSPMVNFFTNAYFNSDLNAVNFKWHVKQKSHDEICSCFVLCDKKYTVINETWEGLKFNGKHEYEYIQNKKDCAFLIKYINKKGDVVHLLGGCGTQGRLEAVNYFATNYLEIHKLYKTKPYFMVAEVIIGDNNTPNHIKHPDDLSYLLKKL